MHSFFEVGKTPAVTAVTNYIGELGRRGILSIADQHMAARHFLGLVDETVLWMRVMGNAKSLTEAETRDVVEQAVAIFIGHYTARPPVDRS